LKADHETDAELRGVGGGGGEFDGGVLREQGNRCEQQTDQFVHKISVLWL
jgi:hypothetical protein